MTKILCQWELAGYHTLSTVPLGIGRMYGYDQKEVAYEMLNCCYRHFKKRTSSSQVIFGFDNIYQECLFDIWVILPYGPQFILFRQNKN